MTLNITENWHATTASNGYRHYDTRKATEELDFQAMCEMPPHANAPDYVVSRSPKGVELDRSQRFWDFNLKCFIFRDMPEPIPVPVVDLSPLLDRFKVSIRKRKR